MLTEDAAFSMPPTTTWFGGPDGGREEIATFLAEYPLNGRWRWRPIQVRANGQPALAYYAWDEEDGGLPAIRAQRADAARRADRRRDRLHRPLDRGPRPRGARPDSRAGLRRRAAWPPPSATSGSRSGSTETGPGRLLGLGLQGMARQLLPREAAAAPLARALRDPLRHGRGQQHLLRAAEARDRRRLDRTDAARASGSRSRRAATSPTSSASRAPRSTSSAFSRRSSRCAAQKRVEAVLWQLPPSFKRDDERLDAALDAITARAPGRHVVEVRHPSWFTGDVYSLLGEREVALAIVDDPALPFAERRLTTLVGLRAPAPGQPRLVLEERAGRPGAGESPPGAPGPRRSSTSTTRRPRRPRTHSPCVRG